MHPAVRVEGLRKSFGETRALDGISFEAPVGSILCLLGPNGAGKTTLVRILTTLLRPSGGYAEILGFDVVNAAGLVREVIGLAGQTPCVDDGLSGVENLQIVGQLYHLGRKESSRRAAELIDGFDLGEVAGDSVSTYSGGTRRRLDLAASLMGRPRVLFLDEPSSGLDLQGRLNLWQRVRDLATSGVSVVLTTQYLEEADKLASWIVVVDKGRIVASGTSDALRRQIGEEFIEVTLIDPASAGEATTLLRGFVSDEARLEADGTRLILPVRGEKVSVPEVVRVLDSSHIGLEQVLVRRPTLDDVFLTMTGSRGNVVPSKQTLPNSAHSNAQLGQPSHDDRRWPPSRRWFDAIVRATTDWLVMTRRNLTKYFRAPRQLLLSAVQTTLFVLMFAYVLGGAIKTNQGTYVNFLLPGLFIWTVSLGALYTGVGLADDASKGMFERFRSLPIVSSAVLAGRVVADSIRNLFILALLAGIGFAVGFRVRTAWALVVALLVSLLFGFAIQWAAALIGLRAPNPEAAQQLGFTLLFPLGFASSAFVPVSSMPAGLATIVRVNPVTAAADAVRGLCLGGATERPLLRTLAWIAGALIVLIAATARTYRCSSS